MSEPKEASKCTELDSTS